MTFILIILGLWFLDILLNNSGSESKQNKKPIDNKFNKVTNHKFDKNLLTSSIKKQPDNRFTAHLPSTIDEKKLSNPIQKEEKPKFTKTTKTIISSYNNKKNEPTARERIIALSERENINRQIKEAIDQNFGAHRKNRLSTTLYAKKFNIKARPHLLAYLDQKNLIEKIDGSYHLTSLGHIIGGHYEQKDGNKWIVWEEGSLDKIIEELIDILIKNLPFENIFHITHIDNIKNINTYGLQSHNNPYKVTDISNTDVNNRRTKSDPIYLKPIHSYVPLYFNPRNAMLFQVQKRFDDGVVILGFDKKTLNNNNIVYTDGNAASGVTRFFDNISTLHDLSWSEIFSNSWSNYGLVNEETKRKMMCEALIPKTIPLSRLKVVYCKNNDTKIRLEKLLSPQKVSVEVNPEMYFH